ncbi:unnamed protein product [Eretmochelys imbricata]
MAFTSSAATSTVQGRCWGCKPPPVPSLQCPDHTDLPSRLQPEDLPHSAVCRFARHPGKWNRGFWDVLGGGAVVSDIAGSGSVRFPLEAPGKVPYVKQMSVPETQLH